MGWARRPRRQRVRVSDGMGGEDGDLLAVEGLEPLNEVDGRYVGPWADDALLPEPKVGLLFIE